MEIRKLPRGETAPQDSDCIKIVRQDGGGYTMVASALLQCGGDDEAVSEALIDGDEYGSYEEAEAAGLAWAEGHCVELVYIESC